MKDLTPEQWKCIYNVMQKEVRHQETINQKKGPRESVNRIKRKVNAEQIMEIALHNAGGPHAKVYEPK